MEKATLKIEPGLHGNSSETFWIQPWFKENTFQIRNVPFYAKGISLGDVVEISEVDGVKYITNILKKSGHSTYRIFLGEGVKDDSFQQYWMPLQEIGCSHEKGYNRFYSVDVPPETDIHKAYSLLENGERNDIWEFEEADVGHEVG